jgi:hypothetical protein
MDKWLSRVTEDGRLVMASQNDGPAFLRDSSTYETVYTLRELSRMFLPRRSDEPKESYAVYGAKLLAEAGFIIDPNTLEVSKAGEAPSRPFADLAASDLLASYRRAVLGPQDGFGGWRTDEEAAREIAAREAELLRRLAEDEVNTHEVARRLEARLGIPPTASRAFAAAPGNPVRVTVPARFTQDAVVSHLADGLTGAKLWRGPHYYYFRDARHAFWWAEGKGSP